MVSSVSVPVCVCLYVCYCPEGGYPWSVLSFVRLYVCYCPEGGYPWSVLSFGPSVCYCPEGGCPWSVLSFGQSVCLTVLKEGVHGQFCHLVSLYVCYCPEREYQQMLVLSFGL